MVRVSLTLLELSSEWTQLLMIEKDLDRDQKTH